MSDVRTFTVDDDDDGIRLDRWFKRHLPDVSFNLVSRWARTGQLRLGGKRAVPGDRVEAGHDHDNDPLKVKCRYTGLELDAGFYSRNREVNPNSSFSVNG